MCVCVSVQRCECESLCDVERLQWLTSPSKPRTSESLRQGSLVSQPACSFLREDASVDVKVTARHLGGHTCVVQTTLGVLHRHVPKSGDR